MQLYGPILIQFLSISRDSVGSSPNIGLGVGVDILGDNGPKKKKKRDSFL